MSDLALGVVGAGTIGQAHASAIEESDAGIDVTAVADIDATTRSEFAETFDVQETYRSYETMFDEAVIDVVLVAIPNALHADCAIAAFERDLNVLVEKPLATTVDDAERVAAATEASDGTALVGHTMVFKPTLESAKRRIEAGEFGDVYDVDLQYVRRRGIPQLGSWFTRKESAGGGVLIDCGVHVISAAMYVLDDPTIETVSATTTAAFGSKSEYTYRHMWGGDPLEDPEFSVEDTVRAFVRTADGTTIHLDCAWASNRTGETSMTFLGSESGVTMDVHSEDATVYSTQHEQLTDTSIDPVDADLFAEEWEYFEAVLRDERPHTKNTLDHAIAVQRLLAAIYESAEEGREVEIAAR